VPTPGRVVPEGSERQCAARRFAEQALRMILEVLDHRRPPAQLRPLVDAALVDVVKVLANATTPSRERGGARLYRLHVQLVDPGRAEVFGSYLRGQRVVALAAQLTLRPEGWRISALHIG
jgi:hypothetical protein